MAEHGGDFIVVGGHVAVDQRPYVNAIVNGSKQIPDGLLEMVEKLDMRGEGEFRREAAKGKWEDFDMCACSTHKGARWLPLERFGKDATTPTGRKRWCSKCRSDAEHERRVREAERRGLRLRDKPGRPKKWKK